MFQHLFPCQPGGTFSSYANNVRRLGSYVLENNGNHLINVCNNLLSQLPPQVDPQALNNIRTSLNTSMPIDTRLACVLFVLDICDTDAQIKNILTQVLGAGAAVIRNANIDLAVNAAVAHNEYSYRPISATLAVGQGDCVQTLYRHLINIAVQNDNTNMRNFNVGHLPIQLHGLNGYYTIRHGAANHLGVITIPVTETEAGLTQLAHHQNWHTALIAVGELPPGRSFTNGAIDDITAVLTAVSNGIAVSALGNRGALPAHMAPLALTLITSTGIGGAGTNQQPNANAIQAALNALDGRGANRFTVSVSDDPATVGGVNGLPHGTDLVIQILDQLWNHRITIGACVAGAAHAHAHAHAEIISID